MIPPTEVDINAGLVRRLVASQFPEFAHLEIQYQDTGWDNESYKIGENLIARIPRRKLAVELLQNEINWLPKLKDRFLIGIPSPLKIGQASVDYPWPWTIVPWYEGQAADESVIEGAAALPLADFLRALHEPAPQNVPVNDYRGVPLVNRAADVFKRMQDLESKTDLITDKIKKLWQDALSEPFPAEAHLIHGDLHPRNIIVKDGFIQAIIDWGDITDGDIATDLAVFWMLFNDRAARQDALEAYGADEGLKKRAIGWAIFYGTIFLEAGIQANDRYAKTGAFILNNVASE